MDSISNYKDVLILAPHTDDGEFGSGGTISKLIRGGSSVTYAAFSSAQESVPEGFPREALVSEMRDATAVLGITRENVRLFDFQVRHFMANRQEVLEILVKLGKEIKPDLVILPSTDDTHQDHQTISQEGFRAFKKTTMLGYEVPWNNQAFKTNCFVELSQTDVNQKISSIECYKSQQSRSYASASFIRSLATVRGGQVGRPYAEVFEVIRWIT